MSGEIRKKIIGSEEERRFDDWTEIDDQEVDPETLDHTIGHERQAGSDSTDLSDSCAETLSADSEQDRDQGLAESDLANGSSAELPAVCADYRFAKYFRQRLKSKESIRLGLAILFVIVLGGLSAVHHQWNLRSAAVNTGFIRRPIIVPSYEGQLGFLILTYGEGQKRGFVNLRLTLRLHSANPAEKFRSNEVAIRDTIYTLLEQVPTGTSGSGWQQVVERDLQSKLKVQFPHCGIASVRLTQSKNL
jgi:hypothetical protein